MVGAGWRYPPSPLGVVLCCDVTYAPQFHIPLLYALSKARLQRMRWDPPEARLERHIGKARLQRTRVESQSARPSCSAAGAAACPKVVDEDGCALVATQHRRPRRESAFCVMGAAWGAAARQVQ
eukprot:gene14307-10607_t